MKNVDDKINKINILLQDEQEFEKYIMNIEDIKCNIPTNLKENLKEIIVKPKKKYRLNFINIMKIAACTIFVVGVWHFTFNEQNINMSHSIYEFNLYETLKTTINDINSVMLTPVRVERGEN